MFQQFVEPRTARCVTFTYLRRHSLVPPMASCVWYVIRVAVGESGAGSPPLSLAGVISKLMKRESKFLLV